MFFSRRRRHTRSTRDWSSDVCSSDLELAAKKDGTILGLRVRTVANVGAYLQAFAPGIPTILHVFIVPGPYRIPAFDYEMRGAYRSEERRVGKESRDRRWGSVHKKIE